MIDPMIAPSARARGFTIGRILSQWPDIVGEMASWCRPDAVAFPRDSRSDGTLRLQIASGRGPQAQAKPRREAVSRLRPRATRSPRRHAVKRRPPRSPRV